MSSSTDWARSIATTIVNHLREEEIASLRKFKFFAALEAAGQIRTNMSGRGFDWEIQYRNHTPSGNNGETPRTFARENLWKKLELEYRGAQVTDAIYKKEMLENRSAQALVNVAGKMASRLLTSMEQYLAKEWIVDGYLPANSLRFHGIESMMGATQTIQVDTAATARSANAADSSLASRPFISSSACGACVLDSRLPQLESKSGWSNVSMNGSRKFRFAIR